MRKVVSTHSRPKAAAITLCNLYQSQIVSTHSRPKAAATTFSARLSKNPCFNTQPPEGGCQSAGIISKQTTFVSTHSRPKAAAIVRGGHPYAVDVSTHSRPKAAAPISGDGTGAFLVSTHSRPKAAAYKWSQFINED